MRNGMDRQRIRHGDNPEFAGAPFAGLYSSLRVDLLARRCIVMAIDDLDCYEQ